MNIKKLITDLQVCADEDILCPACERYGTMGAIGGSAECVEKLLREAAAALEEMQKRISDLPTVDAVEVVYCDECKSHGNCIPEDTFRWTRIKKPYCCAGRRKTNANFDAKMDGGVTDVHP